MCTGRNRDHNSLGSNRVSSLDGGIRQQRWGECEGEEGEGSSHGVRVSVRVRREKAAAMG